MPIGCIEQLYMQSKDQRWNQGHLQKGVCLALSAYWIIHKAKAGSIDSLKFWDWLGVLPNAINAKLQSYAPEGYRFMTLNNDVARMMQSQQNLITVKDKLPHVRYSDIAKDAIVALGKVQHLQDVNDVKFTTHDELMLDMTGRYSVAGEHTYYHYIDMQGASFGHAVAVAYETNGRVYFFDPNAGEVSWNERDGASGFRANDSLVKRVMASYYPPKSPFSFYNVAVFG